MRTQRLTQLAAALLIALAAAPAGSAPAQQAPTSTKAAPPAAGTPKDFRLPATRTFALPNGMQVTLVPFGTIPKAMARLVVRVGNVNEGPNETWLADVTGDLMNEGTTTRSAQQLAEELAGMGGAINVNVTPDETNVGGEVLAEHAPALVRILADVARHPRFPASELPRVKATRARQLAIQKSQPQPIALERFHQTLYGDHPYGRVFPTEAMLQGYTLDQVRAFHAANFGAARAHLYLAGVFDQRAVERAARDAFGDWARGPAPVANVPTAKSARTVALIDRPGAVQSTLYVGLPVPDPTSKDYMPLLVTNSLLGGSFGSRITSNIREQKGYTYSPVSFVSPRYHTAYWVEVADVTTNVTGASLKEIFGEIDRLQKEAPPVPELRGIQNNMAGVFTLQNGSRGGIIGQLQFVDLNGLGQDYLTQYVRRVLAVSPQEVQRIMQTYLRPERMTVVVVGDKKTVEEQIAPYGTVAP